MCGCNSNNGSSMRSGGSCGGSLKILRSSKNRIQTLYTLEQDPVKKEEYLLVKRGIEDSINRSATECPKTADVEALKIYIQNEYTKYGQQP